MISILLSFFSGILLNFMPCVFPLLLIKIYEIIKNSQEKNNNLKIISFSTSLGIISVFSLFSIINIIFNYTNKQFNLGFHFQSPVLLIVIIFFIFLFILNLFNLLDFHTNFLNNLLQKKYQKSKDFKKNLFIENFISGMFLVLFATPCCLPIIGSVATLSLSISNSIIIILNFLFMGLGMSFPFIIVLKYPNLLNFLKEKKKLLKIVHYLLIVVLISTITWLLFVLSTQISIFLLLIFILFLSIIAIQFKILNNSKIKIITSLILFFLSILLPFYNTNDIAINAKNSITQQEIIDYILKDKIVFVEISAKWCLVCNLNQLTTFSNKKVINFLNKEGIINIKIDITKSNKDAELFYKDNNFYVPNYIVYNKRFPNGCRFSGKLTKNKFLKNFNDCKI